MARRVDEPWTKCRNSTGVDLTRAFAHDGRDPRSWPQTEDSMSWNRATLQTNTDRGSIARNVLFACAMSPEKVLE